MRPCTKRIEYLIKFTTKLSSQWYIYYDGTNHGPRHTTVLLFCVHTTQPDYVARDKKTSVRYLFTFVAARVSAKQWHLDLRGTLLRTVASTCLYAPRNLTFPTNYLRSTDSLDAPRHPRSPVSTVATFKRVYTKNRLKRRLQSKWRLACYLISTFIYSNDPIM